jgi:predicted dehydrogenase
MAQNKIRYAVVGLGHIAQVAVLPAFAHAGQNSELSALVSGDPVKLQKMGRRYGVKGRYSYDQFEECLQSGRVDAVYIALPNHLHREYTVRAAQAGVHVLCEKPLARTRSECEEMIQACRKGRVRLMTAYRLHFEKTNLQVARLVQEGRIGTPRIFNSLFSYQVRDANIRVQRDAGGGTLPDIGVYCINAARHLFRAEPQEVYAACLNRLDRRSAEVDAITSAILQFPDNRVATFSTSFASADMASFTVLGSEGSIHVENAYEYSGEMNWQITAGGKTTKHITSKRDHFAPQLLYFSDCILKGRDPEPSGQEGLIDVAIVEALYQSARAGRPVRLRALRKSRRPTLSQEIHRPPVPKVKLVNAEAPSRD